MPDTPEPVSESRASATERALEALQPIAAKVQTIVGHVRVLAWIYLAGAVALWLALVLPGGVRFSWTFWVSVVGMVAFGAPSIVLFLFYGAPQAVVELPARLLEKAGAGEAQARSLMQSARAPGAAGERTGRLLRSFYELRTLVLESKDLLLEYGVLLRLANPFVLGVVALATVAGFLVVVAAAIALVVVLW